MKEKFILLSGRPGAGKSEMIFAIANKYPEKTLILSMEYSKEQALIRGLNKDVVVVEQLDGIDINFFDTICIDYLELFDENYIQELIKTLIHLNKRIIVVTQMRKFLYKVNNIYEKILNEKKI